MRSNIKSIIICIAVILLFTFLSCTDPVGSSTGSGRYVVEVSEANLTGAGGVVPVPQITVGTSGDGGAAMPSVIVYGNGRNQDETWREGHRVGSECDVVRHFLPCMFKKSRLGSARGLYLLL